MDARKLNVLIVEDDEETRLSMEDYFDMKGCAVRTAASVAYARHVIASGFSPDVVISDWRLDGPEDGIELIREVRRFKPESQTYLISGYPVNNAMPQLKEIGFSGFYPKPVPLHWLARQIGV